MSLCRGPFFAIGSMPTPILDRRLNRRRLAKRFRGCLRLIAVGHSRGERSDQWQASMAFARHALRPRMAEHHQIMSKHPIQHALTIGALLSALIILALPAV